MAELSSINEKFETSQVQEEIMNKCFRAYMLASIILFVFIIFPSSGLLAQTMSSGWQYPTGSSNFCGYLGWLGYNSGWGYHLAQDMCNNSGSPVYSIGDGEVISSGSHNGYGCNGDCPGGCVLARYQAADGTWFIAMYGHLDSWVGAGSVYAGKIIGYTRSDWNPPHLHFSIHQGYDQASNPWDGYTPTTSNTYGFVDPIPFLNAHPSKTVNGLVKVSSLSISPSAVVLGVNFNISFTLREINGASKMFEDIAVAILDASGNYLYDAYMRGNPLTISADGAYPKTITTYIYTSRPAGTYYAIVRGKLNGSWFDFDTYGSADNPRNFIALSQAGDHIPGDMNNDGKVSMADYSILRSNYGQTNCGNPADTNGDCIVNMADYSILRTNYGMGQ